MRSSPLAISDSSHQSRLGTGRGALDAMKKIECLQVNIYISFYIDCLKITARSKRYPSLLQFGKRTASSPTFTPLKCRTGKMTRRLSWCGLWIARMLQTLPSSHLSSGFGARSRRSLRPGCTTARSPPRGRIPQ